MPPVNLHAFANPARALRLAGAIAPVAWGLAALLIPLGLFWGLVRSPPDYQQGETVRIMYVHVPSAWLCMAIYAAMAVSAAVGFIWKHPVADLVTRAIAPIGAACTLICLVTGSLWGQPTWGTWWVWDARLTSVLILFFLYLGYLALLQAYDDPARGTRVGAILVMVGASILPIIKFSVDWWNTLHQPATITLIPEPGAQPSITAYHGTPLLLMALGLLALTVGLACVRLRGEIAQRAARLRLLAAALEGPSAAPEPGRGDLARA